MTQIILDAALRSKLHDLSKPLDLCDESGKVLAHVIPALDPADYEPVPPPELSQGDLKTIEQSARWYTSEQVLKHLESL